MNDNAADFKEIKVDEKSPLFDTKNMFYKEFPSDFRQIRYFTLLIVQKAPPSIKELNLLEQQISEIIKNAVKHGNKNNPEKKVKVWYYFSEHEARLIVEDEGSGFKDIEKWNDFNRKRLEAFLSQDYVKLADYVSYRTAQSDDNDGGNALFAALEYWNAGYVFGENRNKVGAKKIFPKKAIGIDA
ncbi:ATP-binding protein [Spirochaeta dissipatitropha]